MVAAAVDTLKKMIRSSSILQVLLFIAVCFAGVYMKAFTENSNSNLFPENEVQRSSFNKRPSGSSAAYEIAEKSGLSCKHWQKQYRDLAGCKGTLVILQPDEPPKEFEAQSIIDWVKEGNNVIYVDTFGYKFMRHLLNLVEVDATQLNEPVDKKINIDSARKEFEHISTLHFSTEAYLTGGSPLIKDGEDTCFCVVPKGKGKIYIGVAPSIWANDNLDDSTTWSNYQFLINLLGTRGGDVYFDEKCHGHIESNNIFIFLMKGATGAVCAQLLLIGIIAVLSAGQRFGQTRRIIDKRQISNLEYINGLTNTYMRAHANQAVLEMIEQSFKIRLCRSLRISPTETNQRIVEEFSRQMNDQTKTRDLSDFFDKYQKAMENPKVANSELRNLIASCDKILAELSTKLSERLLNARS